MNFKQQLYAIFIKIHEFIFGHPLPVGMSSEFEVSHNAVNPVRKIGGTTFQYKFCPDLLWSSKMVNGWITIRLVGPHVRWIATESSVKVVANEKYEWINYPVVRFMVSKNMRIIYEIRVDANAIMRRGAGCFSGREYPDWPYYVNSVILAHLETLKFTGNKQVNHAVIVGKILTNYGAQVFEELIDEQSYPKSQDV